MRMDFEERVLPWIKFGEVHVFWGFVEASSWEVRPVNYFRGGRSKRGVGNTNCGTGKPEQSLSQILSS